MGREQVETVVIGGGQAGLAVGYHLTRQGLPLVILDENPRIGDSWRMRWDSLRLFTPARYSSLPGMRFPGSPAAYPTKDETADYMEAYARQFGLPVRTGVRVDSVSAAGDRFEVVGGDHVFLAENVVVASGANHSPRIPGFASELDESILQLHSKEYRNPSQLRQGGVLVVGAGNSGAEIAVELAPNRRTWLSGRDPGQEPTRAGSLPDRVFTPMMWFMATRVLTVNTPMGRKVRARFLNPPRGIPLGRVRRKDFEDAGIERVPKVAGVRNGYPMLRDGQVLKEVSNVIWCTGLTPSLQWLDLPFPTNHGIPVHTRGIVESIPGLYFVGLLFPPLAEFSAGGGRRPRRRIHRRSHRCQADG